MTDINNALSFLTVFLLIGFLTPGAQAHRADPDKNPTSSSATISIVLQPYTGHSSGAELSKGPNTLLPGLQKLLAELEIDTSGTESVKLTPKEEKDYGVWHRVGLAVPLEQIIGPDAGKENGDVV